MSKNETLTDRERWLAAEYALGVLNPDDMARAAAEADRSIAFRHEVEAWQNQLLPLLDDVEDRKPPQALWNRISEEVGGGGATSAAAISSGSGFWKWMTAFSSTAAVASLGALVYFTGGDFQGRELNAVKQQLASVEQQVAQSASQLENARSEIAVLEQENRSVEEELANSRDALEAAEGEIAGVQQELDQALNQVAEFQDRLENTQPLVASLTQSGDLPAFVAQYDPLRQALLIRSAIEDEDERVPELWLIPEQGERKGEVLSMGVLDESSPNTVPVTDEFLPLIGEGGTLAISMEPPGGAPEGVATGPIIAVGKFQGL